MKEKAKQGRDLLSIKGAKTHLRAWETATSDVGEVSLQVGVFTGDNNNYIQLSADQQKALGEWLIGPALEDAQKSLNAAFSMLLDIQQSAYHYLPSKSCYCGWCQATRANDLQRGLLIQDRDGWRAKAAEEGAKNEDLEHQIGELKEKLRQLKHYVNSLGGE